MSRRFSGRFDPDAVVPLPEDAVALLRAFDAPPRLVAHLRLVHDVALHLVSVFATRWPLLAFDRAAILFGAATHDIGKAIHRDELTEPGALHEEAGRRAMEAHGVTPALARFAVTHAAWSERSSLEDLLVALADKVWKGKRVADLETLVIAHVARATSATAWSVFGGLDAVLTELAADADARLAWHARHPA